jgi:hypothetical protein
VQSRAACRQSALDPSDLLLDVITSAALVGLLDSESARDAVGAVALAVFEQLLPGEEYEVMADAMTVMLEVSACP